jgi:hypothetical protein
MERSRDHAQKQNEEEIEKKQYARSISTLNCLSLRACYYV